MKTAVAWRAAACSHPGLERPINEDRVLVDDARGLFLVVDGLGGHAAGEVAAAAAVRAIEESLHSLSTDPHTLELQLRQAITAANNSIYELAQSNREWQGMACVLTLAAACGDRMIVGHVGDSRLYLIWNGKLRKVTNDHSPVGELEDQGQLTESEAMRHPRRNEVFRDAGSMPHQPDDPQFIDTKNLLFRPDAALLLCSDGLSDYVASTQIGEIIERYDGDAAKVAQQLVEAGNAAGGRDNISVVFVAGPEFLGVESGTLSDTRSRHATTRMRSEASSGGRAFRGALLVLAGIVIGLLLWRFLDRLTDKPIAHKADPPAARQPQTVLVNSADSLGIINALASAQPGDNISVPPGEYLGPLQLKDHVNIIATVSRQAIVRSDPASAVDPGIALAAHNVAYARIAGLHIAGDDTHPLRTGILLGGSSVEVDDCEVSGAIDSGIRVEGDSHALLLGNFVHGGNGPGIIVRNPATPRLVGNHISENGQPELQIDAGAHPVLEDNFVSPKTALKKPAASKTKSGGPAA
jgi:PPM family protein phosphatase